MFKPIPVREFLASEWEFLRTDPIEFIMCELQAWFVVGTIVMAICAMLGIRV